MSAELPGRNWTPRELAALSPDGLGGQAAREHLRRLELALREQDRRHVAAARRSAALGEYESIITAKISRAIQATREIVQREGAGNI